MSSNPEFKAFQKQKRESEELGRNIEIAGFRDLTENERAILRDRLNTVSKKLEDRVEGAIFKLDKSLRNNEDQDLSDRLAVRLGELVNLREKLKSKKELIDEAEK